MLKHCAANRKRRFSALPNVGPYIYDIKISGFTGSSIYIHDISRLRVNDVGQTEIHTEEPQVPAPSAFEVEMTTEKLKSHKSPGTDQIPAELFDAGGRKNRFDIHKRITSIRNKEELPEEWKESIVVPICKKDDKTDDSNNRGISLLSTTYKNCIRHPATPYSEEIIRDNQCEF
jgi:hypothetical protein